MPHADPAIYTVGHSNHSLDTFLSLLKTYRIAVVADVRSQPSSQYTPHFNGGSLKAALPAAGIEYLFLGKELGGRPQGDQFYDDAGHVLYARVAAAPLFQRGLSVLVETAAQRRVALLCGEEDPAECHRRLLLGRVLAEQGLAVIHIRGDGKTQTEEELAREEKHKKDGGQLMLFEVEEEAQWRSTRSVSAGNRPGSSSER